MLSARGVCVKGHGGSKNVVDHGRRALGRNRASRASTETGRQSFVYALTGLVEPEEGTVTLNGQISPTRPSAGATRAVWGHIPEDRHRHGLVLIITCSQFWCCKAILSRSPQPRLFEVRRHLRIRRQAHRHLISARARARAPITRSMSGGNPAPGRRAGDRPRPGRAHRRPAHARLDVGAIEYIHGKLVEERDAGKAILPVSPSWTEVMQLSDRILVIYEGRGSWPTLTRKQSPCRSLGFIWPVPEEGSAVKNIALANPHTKAGFSSFMASFGNFVWPCGGASWCCWWQTRQCLLGPAGHFDGRPSDMKKPGAGAVRSHAHRLTGLRWALPTKRACSTSARPASSSWAHMWPF